MNTKTVSSTSSAFLATLFVASVIMPLTTFAAGGDEYSIFSEPLIDGTGNSYDSYSVYSEPLYNDTYSVFSEPLTYNGMYSVYSEPLGYQNYSVYSEPLYGERYSVTDEVYYDRNGCGSYCGGSSYSSLSGQGGCGYCGSSSYRPYSYTPSYSYSTPISVSSPRYPQYTAPATNTNINTNVNNNTAIAIAYAAPQQVAPAPYCTINHALAQGYGLPGQGANSAYLSWTSTNAISAYLSSVGSVALNGSQTVWSGQTTTYTLTVYGANGQQAACSTTVVKNYVPPVQHNPYVALTQIPYTGFDGGLLLNSMYWIDLIAFALAGAYVVVYYTGDMASFAGMQQNRQFAPVIAPKAPILIEKELKVTEEPIEKMAASLRTAIGTKDTMAIVQGKGLMPRIVIDRSY